MEFGNGEPVDGETRERTCYGRGAVWFVPSLQGAGMLPLRLRFGLVALALLALVACTLPPGDTSADKRRLWDWQRERESRETHDTPLPEASPEAKAAAG